MMDLFADLLSMASNDAATSHASELSHGFGTIYLNPKTEIERPGSDGFLHAPSPQYGRSVMITEDEFLDHEEGGGKAGTSNGSESIHHFNIRRPSSAMASDGIALFLCVEY